MKKPLCVIIMMFALVCLLASCGKHTHDYGEWENVTKPTCTVDGSKVRYCTCGEEQIKPIYATGHIEIAYSAVDATCTNTGLTEGKFCSVCKEVIVAQAVVPALGHIEVVDAAVDATCTETGLTEGKHCSVCKEVIVAQTVVPALGHTEVVDEAVDATCTETGLTEGKHCSTCNEIFVAQTEIAKISHTYDDKYDESCNKCGFIRDAECAHLNVTSLPAKNATCTDSGLTEGKVCAKCEEILVAQTVIDALGHKYNSVITDSDCTNQGYTTYTCSDCGDSYVDNYTNALGHTESDWIIDTNPYFGVTGLKHKQCTLCLVTILEEVIPALPLDDVNEVDAMNTILASSPAANNVDTVVETLINGGYKGTLHTYLKEYEFAWLASENVIVLVQNNAVVYPKANIGATDYVIISPMAIDAEALINSLQDGRIVFVGCNISADKISIDTSGDYRINLNGYTLTLENRVQAYNNDTKLLIYNGIIESGSTSCSVYSNNGGCVELNNVQIYGASGANSVQCYGGTMLLNNVTTVQNANNDSPAWYNSAIQVVNYIQLQENNGRYQIITQASATINGGVYTGDKAIQISAPGGNVTIKAGTLTGTDYVINADFAPGNYIDGANFESVITIDGGTLNGNIKISAATELVINGGSFNGDTIKIGSNAAVALTFESLSRFITAGSTVVINGETFTKLDANAQAWLTSDKQTVNNINNTLAAYAVTENINNIYDVVATMKECGFDSENCFIPHSEGHSFYWNRTANKIVLVNSSNEVVHPQGVPLNEDCYALANYYTSIEVKVGDVDSLLNAINSGVENITLSSNLSDIDSIVIPVGKNVTIDLGGKTITTGYTDVVNGRHAYAFDVYGTLTIKNGTINARGVQTYAGANLIIEDGITINSVDDNGGACVYIREGSNVTINGGNFESLACKSEVNGGSVIINDGGEVIINGGTFVSKVNGPYVINHWSGKTTINGGTFNAVRGVVVCESGTLTINGGIFTKTDLNNKAGYELYVSGNAKVTVAGGTFTNEIFYGYSRVAVLQGSVVIPASCTTFESALGYLNSLSGHQSITCTVNGVTGKTGVAISDNIKLSEDVVIDINNGTSTLVLHIVGDVTIDLNGHSITQYGQTGQSLPLFVVGAGSTLNIIDSSANKTGGIYASYTAAQISTGGTLNLYSGTIGVTPEEHRRADDGIESLFVYGGTFNMYGGKVDATEESWAIGNSYAAMASTATVNLYGGEIIGWADLTNITTYNNCGVSITGIYPNEDITAGWTKVDSANALKNALATKAEKIMLTADIIIEDSVTTETLEIFTVIADTEINLNGHNIIAIRTIPYNISKSIILINVKSGTLTLSGSGVISLGHTVSGSSNMGWNALSATIRIAGGSASVVINDAVVVEHTGGTDLAFAIDVYASGNAATVTMNGGALYSTYTAIRFFYPNDKTTGSININAGGLFGESRDVWVQTGSEMDCAKYVNIANGYKVTTNEAGNNFYID